MNCSSSTLVVIVHGWKAAPGSMEGIAKLARAELGTDVRLCQPHFGFQNPLSTKRATKIVQIVLEAIDAEVAKQPVNRIVLIGHSIGATVLRRVFLVAAGKPANFTYEEGLASEGPRGWARCVERIVLIASFNRGWSVSERTGWIYAIGFNIVGLLGHLSPTKDWTPGIFDFRLGAPFMVQTRLHWMAHRRQEPATDRAPPPIVVQVIGTQDDLIVPFDQVDISVDGTRRALVATTGALKEQVAPVGAAERDYFLLEMPQTNHASAIVVFDKKGQRTHRYDVLKSAVTGTRVDLNGLARDPALLADQVPPVDETVTNTVFVIHGIRDDGFWTHRIAERIRIVADPQSRYAFRSWTPTYGYFAMLPFMLPWIRRQKVEWFMDQYVSAFAQYPNSDFHYVGHSNGTYLAAGGFKDYPSFHLRHVLFAGSVVRSDFDWASVFALNRVEMVQNIIASADWVVACFPKGVEWWKRLDLGGAGVDGFVGKTAQDSRLHQLEFAKGGHGAGIVEGIWSQIADFIVKGTPVVNDRSDLFTKTPNRFIKLLGNSRLVLPILLVLILGVVPMLIVGDLIWWRAILLALYIALLRFLVLRV